MASEKDYLKTVVNDDNEEDYIWCKISDSGELQYIDWLYVKKKSEEFDKAGSDGYRDQMATTCKLMVLSRQQTIEKMMEFMERFFESDNNTPALISYDPTSLVPPPPATFVFFHVGDDLTQPKRLVDSLQKTNCGAEIIMCTDSSTPEIEGVTRFETEVNREYIMSSRWKSFSELNLDRPAIYTDTDMRAQGFINLPSIIGNKKYVFCHRTFDQMTPFNGMQRDLDFSEHDGKPLGFVYPILACFVATKSGAEWKELYERCAAQPDKYQRWYGDQEVLRDFVKTLKVQDFNLVEESLFACLPEYVDKNFPFLVHYKGNRKNADD